MNNMPNNDTATAKEVAAYLHTSEGGLAQMRYRGIGPKFIKVGPRKVIYRWSDVQEHLDANTCQRADAPRGGTQREACTLHAIEQMNALPDGAVVLDDMADVLQRDGDAWTMAGHEGLHLPILPVLLIWHPDWAAI